MNPALSCLVALAGLGIVASDPYHGGYNGAGAPYNSVGHSGYQKPVAILSHKQAQAHDGTVNHGFSAENGIHQGEVINPDGSRQGSYSYVDPSGKTISLKYVAGKDGFHVLEGDHIPKAVPLPATHQAAYAEAFARSQNAPEFASGPYKAPYKKTYQHYEAEPSEERNTYEPSGNYQHAAYRSASFGPNSDEESQHNGPHSFGNGYAFEFGSH